MTLAKNTAFNPLNPIHYIALHNSTEVLPLLGNFGFQQPQNEQHYFATIDQATEYYGDKFIEAMVKVHPDRELFKRYSNFVSDDYVVRVRAYTLPQLQAELEVLSASLRAATDDKSKADLLDTIAFVQKQIIEKMKERPLPTSSNGTVAADAPVSKTTNLLLYALVAVALMYLGSKIFKS